MRARLLVINTMSFSFYRMACVLRKAGAVGAFEQGAARIVIGVELVVAGVKVEVSFGNGGGGLGLRKSRLSFDALRVVGFAGVDVDVSVLASVAKPGVEAGGVDIRSPVFAMLAGLLVGRCAV